MGTFPATCSKRYRGLRVDRIPGALLMLILLASEGGLWAEPFVDPGPTVLPNRPQIETLGIRDGLAHSKIHRVHQDRDGDIWIASESHLQRFDGLELRSFKPLAGHGGQRAFVLR